MKKRYLMGVMLAVCAAGVSTAQVRSASQPQKLIESEVGFMAPVWSPDGSMIAVTSDNYSGIYVADANGSNLRVITTEPGAGYKMLWSADSRSITGAPRVADGARQLRSLCTYDLATGEANRGSLRKVARPGADKAEGIYGAMIADPAGAAVAVPVLSRFAGRTIINPALSPDGKLIAFQVPGQGMWLIGADGAGLRSLGKGSHPSWMPDSHTILYTIVEDNGSEFTASTLMSADVTTGFTSTVLSENGVLPLTPAVAPDGSKVAFENARDAAIYIVKLKK